MFISHKGNANWNHNETYPPEWLKIVWKDCQHKILVRLQNNWNSHNCWWVCKMAQLWERSSNLCKTKFITILWPSTFVPIFTKRNENMWLYKDSYKNVHGSFVCNSQTLEWPSWPSTGKRTNKLQCYHTMDEYLATKSKELLTHQQHTWTSKTLHWVEKSLTQRSLYAIMYTKF